MVPLPQRVGPQMAEELMNISSYSVLTSFCGKKGAVQETSNEPSSLIECMQCIQPGSRFYGLQLSFLQ